MSDELNDLPQGWASVRLGDVTEPKIEQGGPAGTEEFCYIDISSVDNERKVISNAKRLPTSEAPSRARQRVKAGDVLVSMTRPNLNAVATVPAKLDGAIASTGFDVLRPIGGLSEWLFAHVRSEPFINSMSELVRGALYPAVNSKEIRAYKLPLPPLPEQRRIVAKIEALQSRSSKAREALEAIPPLLEQFRQSVLAAAFRGDLTSEWREQHPDVEPARVLLDRIRTQRRQKWEEAELAKFKAKGKLPKDDSWKQRYAEPEPVNDSDLPDLPEGWCWASLDDLCTTITDGEHISPKTCSSGVPLLSAKDVRESGVLFEEVKFVSAKDAEQFWKRCLPEKGDLLLVSRGATVGRSTILASETPFCLMGSVILGKVNLPSMAEYLGRFMESAFAKKHLRSVSGASAQQAIYIRDVRACPIPIAPQREIAAVTAACNIALNSSKLIGGYTASSLELVGQLDQSLLAKAFRGELVPQDPNDEPASVLLGLLRAKQQRETSDKPVRKLRK